MRSCRAIIGLRRLVTSNASGSSKALSAYSGRAFAVPRPALLPHEGRSGVLLRVGYRLRFVPVSILSEDERRFFIGDTAGLQGQDVLTRSVSSVQGLLLGLGSD